MNDKAIQVIAGAVEDTAVTSRQLELARYILDVLRANRIAVVELPKFPRGASVRTVIDGEPEDVYVHGDRVHVSGCMSCYVDEARVLAAALLAAADHAEGVE